MAHFLVIRAIQWPGRQMVSISVAISQLCNKDIYFNTQEIQLQCPNHVNSQTINLWLQQVKYGQCASLSVLQFPGHLALILRITHDQKENRLPRANGDIITASSSSQKWAEDKPKINTKWPRAEQNKSVFPTKKELQPEKYTFLGGKIPQAATAGIS